jgi:hypothetical protein
VSVQDWNWSLRIFDHVDVHAGDYADSVRFYREVGNIGHGASPTLR